MSFGTDLKNQIPTILDHISDGIHELHVVRNFIKDRCQIEREYAHKLENLSKKYSQHVKLPPVDESDELDWNFDISSATLAWATILKQTGQIAKCRLRFAEDLATSIVEVLKSMEARKEDARKKHAAFFNKLKADKEKTLAEKDKAKQAYEDACNEVLAVHSKLSKGTGDQEKHQKQLDQAGLDCNNKKNLYILALGVANAENQKYYEEDLPSLADHLQSLDCSRIYSLQHIFTCYIGLETSTIVSVQNDYCKALEAVGKIDPAIDANVFIRQKASGQNDSHSTLNAPFVFSPSTEAASMIEQDSSLTTDETSAIFLNNMLIKGKKQLEDIAEELSQKSGELKQLEQTVNAIGNKTSAEYDQATERLMEVARQITLLSTQKVRIKSEVDLIVQSIGVNGLNAQNHDFKASSFTIPTSCDFCGNTIWGLSKGLTCKSCGLNCHAKCEMNVSPNCSHVRGKINQQAVPVYRPKMRQKTEPENSAKPAENGVRPPETQEGYLGEQTTMPENGQAGSSTPTVVDTHVPSAMTGKSAGESHLPVTMARALYAYEAQTEDELSIEEGELLSVIEKDGGNGWIKVSRGNQVGYVPANYMAMNDMQPENADTTQQSTPAPDYVTALYDFEAVNADELNIREGDKILVTRRDDTGWWEGTVNGRTGVFPANYVK